MSNHLARRIGLGASLLALTASAPALGAVVDYSNGSDNTSPIVLTDNSTQLQVTTGTATQSGVISESGGSFGLEKIGAGTLILTSNSTYTGDTLVSVGSLQLGNGNPTGHVAGNITNNAQLIFDYGNILNISDETYTGTISGTGQVQVTGSVILSGANVYSDGTTISNAGHLVLADGGSIIGSVTNDGLLGFNKSSAFIFANSVSGSGSLSSFGSGTVILTGNNTYTGVTSVTNTLQIGNGGTTGSIVGDLDIGNTGTVIFDRSDDVVYGGAISLNGSIIKLGNNKLTLSGPNFSGSTTIDGGILQFGAGGASTSYIGTVSDNGTLVVDYNTTFNIRGAISGSGGVQQIGSGTLLLTGTNTYTGTTLVSAGTLQIGEDGGFGSIVSNVVNNAAVVFSPFSTSIYAGSISGPGSVTKTCCSVSGNFSSLILTGTNTYTGGTVVSEGTLQIGNGGTSGSIVGDVTDNAILAFNRSDVIVFGGAITGTGQLNQGGTGTLILTGASGFTGGTTISAGTLQIGNGGIAGSVSGNITNNAMLSFNRSDSIVYGGVISGFGSLAQSGAGTLILTGNNSFTGLTTVSAGTLQIGNGGTTGSISASLSILNNATLSFDRSDVFTFGNAVSGMGALKQIGSGTLILTDPGLYLGGTTIGSGVLQIGNGGFTGSISGNVVDNAVLVFNRSNNVSFAGSISGTGSLNQLGGGALILTGANNYTGGTTISAGTLQIGNGGAAGSVTGNVTDNGALAFNRSDAMTFSGVISGSGALRQIGSGVTTLSATNTYTGGTTISAGTLNVTGSIASSAVSVSSGANLTGTGKTGALSFASGGTLSPGVGGAPGTLTVQGNLALASGANYVDAISPTVTGLTSVSGSASVNGALSVNAAAGSYTLGQRYTLLSAAGGLSGTFATVSTTGLNAYRTSIGYDTSSVFLTLSANAFAAIACGFGRERCQCRQGH